MKRLFFTGKTISYFLTLACLFSLNVIAFSSCDGSTESSNLTDSVADNSPKILHGELESITENAIDGKSIVVVKTKITPSFTNKGTIDQNYFNVEDLIQKQGYDKYDEIQYWAVADMTDGSESKVISFTVSKELIENIKNEKVVAIEFDKYVDDLWILPSLKG